MNKQQLAAKIWESANQMRSKIEANEYKDYILGFIFYKYLSDQQEEFLRAEEFTEEKIQELVESQLDTAENQEILNYIKEECGYFIAYDNLFSTWLKNKKLGIAQVRDAFSAFNRHINEKYKALFDGIFNTLETGLSRLGSSTGEQSKAINNLIQLIKDIPTDNKQGYDVLGFIYEYLIGMFAANAGKKAGEFYTPHEVSVLIAELIAEHLKDRKTIDIYDPTSGSGSLLLNIGQAVAKHQDSSNKIKYFAQELKENTYNLTRMNLVMRGISPDNIQTRNADTLEDDWPNSVGDAQKPLRLDAVVSNPPYSQKWDPTYKESDPRYSRFGLAPKSKADYAFLLHDLYHLKPKGIMAIVLPHGVLFRGGEEGKIRRNLIEGAHIETIIGLPANIFFGTGIPTIIMLLRQVRKNNDILMIDASKGFVKEGKNNQLRACDIKKIADAVTARADIPRFSRLVSKEEIQNNDYNLNIPRYVDTSETEQHWDLYASMFGGVPNSELDALNNYWQALPQLRQSLFDDAGTPYSTPQVEDFAQAIRQHQSVKNYQTAFKEQFADFQQKLRTQLIDNFETLKIHQQQELLAQDIFARLKAIAQADSFEDKSFVDEAKPLINEPLIDKYQAYQLLADQWEEISIDLEILQTEGLSSAKRVDPILVTKRIKGVEAEIQEGWKGRILPFELVQRIHLSSDTDKLAAQQRRLAEIPALLDELIESLSEDEGEYSVLNENNDKFLVSELTSEIYEQLLELDNEPKLSGLLAYLALLDRKPSDNPLDKNQKATRAEKLSFIESNPLVDWSSLEANRDGTYSRSQITLAIGQLIAEDLEVSEELFLGKLLRASRLLEEEKRLRSEIRLASESLHLATKTKIEGLTDQEIFSLLENKWIVPFIAALSQLVDQPLSYLSRELEFLSSKYQVTFADNAEAIAATGQELSSMMGELEGNEFDLKGIAQLQKYLSIF